MKSTADTFVAAYNKDGGKSSIVSLPVEGIYGNDHMMFQDLNNGEIANLIEKWISKNAVYSKNK